MTPKEAQEKYDNLKSLDRKRLINSLWISAESSGIFDDWLAKHPELLDETSDDEIVYCGYVATESDFPTEPPKILKAGKPDVNDDEPYVPLEIKSAFDPWGDEAQKAKDWYGSRPNETRKKMYDEWAGRNKDEKNRISWTDFLIMRHKSEPTKSAAMKEFEEKETVNGGEHHYNRGKGTETIDYMEQCAEAWRANGLPEKKIVNLVQALKYLSPRLGRKDDIDIELGKALNYVYRALHGEWMV